MTTQANAEKESLLQLLRAEENEMKRLAKEIHHDLAQSLELIKLDFEEGIRKIEGYQIKPDVEFLQNVLLKIDQAIGQVKKIGMRLWPPTLENAHLGILATLSWLCREFQEAHPGVRIDTQIGIQEEDVPDFLKSVIYKILRDALNNTKHSDATVIRIVFLRRELTIELTIQDNGRGFDVEGEGLTGSDLALSVSSVRTRTEITGGSFAIDSVIGKGTLLRAWWPIES